MPTPEELQYQNTVNRLAAQSGMLNPEAVQNALAMGGSLGGSLGFNSGADVAGMTPEQVQSLVKNRTDIMQQNLGALKGAAEVSDLITGRTKSNEMQMQLARDQFSQGNENARQQKSLDQQMQIHEDNFEKDWFQFDATMENHRLDRESREREGRLNRSQSDRQFKEQMDLKRSELMAIKEAGRAAALSGFTPQSVQGFVNTFSDAKNSAYKEERWKDYHTYTLQEMSMTTPINSVINSNSFADYNGGWPQLKLMPDGHWWGVKQDKTGKVISWSSGPLVHNPLATLQQAAAASGGGTKLVNKYQQKAPGR